jgi:hypothetical protein
MGEIRDKAHNAAQQGKTKKTVERVKDRLR